MKRKSFISLFLATMMAVSVFAGCGQKASEPATEEKTSTPTQSESKSEAKPEETAPVDEPATKITIGCNTPLQSEPVSWHETDVWKEIWKLANVEVEFIQYDGEQYNLALASGDLPDILVCGGTKLDDIIKGGLALDLYEYAELAPNVFSETFQQRNSLVSEMKGGDDNALYFIATAIGKENARGGVDTSRGYSVRWDWYKEIGAPEMKSSDDYLDVIEQILAAHPTTEKGEKVLGMGLANDLTNWYFRACFEEPVLLNPWLISGSQYMVGIDDAKIYNGYTNLERSAFWTDMKFYNEAYKRGLLDPDSFTQTADEMSTKVKAGRYVSTQPTRNNALYEEMRKSDPETLAGYVRIPTENYLVFSDKKMLTGDFPSGHIWINAKTKNVEACMRVLNTLHDLDVQRMIESGIEGVHWNYVNGVPTFTEETIQMIMEDGDARHTSGVYMEFSPGRILQRSFLHPDGYPICLNDTDEMRAATLPPLHLDMAEHYGVTYPTQYGVKLVEEGKATDMSNDSAQLIASYMPSRPTDISRIITNINDIIYKAVPKLVMAKDDAEFEAVQQQVLKDLADAGEADAWNWVKSGYEEAAAVIRPIFEACEW